MDFKDLDTSLKVTSSNVNLHSSWLYNNRFKLLAISAGERSSFIKKSIGSSIGNAGAIISFLKKTGLVNADLSVSFLAEMLATDRLSYPEICFIHLSKQSLFKGNVPTANLLNVISNYIISNGIDEFEIKDIRSLDESLSPVAGDITSNSRTDYILTVLEGTGLFIHVGNVEDGRVRVRTEALPIITYIANNSLTNCVYELNSIERFDFFAGAVGGVFAILSSSLPTSWTSFFPHLTGQGITLPTKKDVKNLQIVFYGAPGTGKSHEIKNRTVGKSVIRTTFHPDSDYSTFVGCYKPTVDKKDDKITYSFVTQAFMKAYLAAWKKYSDVGATVSNPLVFLAKSGRYTIIKVDSKSITFNRVFHYSIPTTTLHTTWNKIWKTGSFAIPKGSKSGRSLEEAIAQWINDNIKDCKKDSFDEGIKALKKELSSKTVVVNSEYQTYAIASGEKDDEFSVSVEASITRSGLADYYNSVKSLSKAEDIRKKVVKKLQEYDSVSLDNAWDKLTKAVNEGNTSAVQNNSAPSPQYLVIEEINRGNCAQIFGDLFQLLDRGDNGFSEYPIEADTDLQQEIERAFSKDNDYKLSSDLAIEGVVEDYTSNFGKSLSEDVQHGRVLLLPSNLYIWATMNTSDQSLFPIDSAFKRRWDWKYFSIKDEGRGYIIELTDGTKYDWWTTINKLNKKIYDTTHSADKQLGYWFVKLPKGVTRISGEAFVSKVVFYLWNDVFKDYNLGDNNAFSDTVKFEDFFDSKGSIVESTIVKFMEHNDIKAIPESADTSDPKSDAGADSTAEPDASADTTGDTTAEP